MLIPHTCVSMLSHSQMLIHVHTCISMSNNVQRIRNCTTATMHNHAHAPASLLQFLRDIVNHRGTSIHKYTQAVNSGWGTSWRTSICLNQVCQKPHTCVSMVSRSPLAYVDNFDRTCFGLDLSHHFTSFHAMKPLMTTGTYWYEERLQANIGERPGAIW